MASYANNGQNCPSGHGKIRGPGVLREKELYGKLAPKKCLPPSNHLQGFNHTTTIQTVNLINPLAVETILDSRLIDGSPRPPVDFQGAITAPVCRLVLQDPLRFFIPPLLQA